MQRRAATRLDPMNLRFELFAMVAPADAFRRNEQIGFAVVGDERKDIVVGQLIDCHRRGLARFLQLRAFHRTAPIQDDREIHRRATSVVALARFDLDLHDHFARAKPVNVFAFGCDSKSHIRRG